MSQLKKARLRRLEAAGSTLADLSALRGAPLEYLNIFGTPVTDLAPLRGAPLHLLNIVRTRVTDLTPLRDSPLKELSCDFVPQRDTEVLRSMKKLSRINNLPVAEFWKKVAAGEVPKM